LKTLETSAKISGCFERYQNRFLYIHVDEYQDTNKVQNAIVELLANKHKNIALSATQTKYYSWRGAEIKNMLHFEKNISDSSNYFLEQIIVRQKYSSGGKRDIEKNNFRIPKKLFTEIRTVKKWGYLKPEANRRGAFYRTEVQRTYRLGISPEAIAVCIGPTFSRVCFGRCFCLYGVAIPNARYQFLKEKK